MRSHAKAPLGDVGGCGASICRLALILAAVCCTALLFTPIASAGLVPGFGKVGSDGGEVLGLAANTASSGPLSGHVYLSDAGNNRVTEYTGSGELVRAFGVDVVASGPGQSNEIQRIAVRATGGKFTLTIGGKTTGELEWNVPASGGVDPTASVANALNELESINAGGGSVTVSGGPGDAGGTAPYVVTFDGGPLAGTDVAQMTAANVSLTGGTPSSSVTVATTNAGATGFEICQAGVDTCQAGAASAAAGGISLGRGIAVDSATGNVFLANETNRRINVYSGEGQFEGAFGWKVDATSPQESLQFCTFVSGCQAGSSGAGAGQFAGMTGPSTVAAAPAVNPANGHLLFADAGNRRVDDFALTLSGSQVVGASYAKGFGGDVTPTINEKQTVAISGATGGTFALVFKSKSTSVTGTGDLELGSAEVTNFSPSGGRFTAGEEVSGPGIPAGTRILAVTFDSLTLSAPVTATQVGASLSAALPFNPSAKNLEDALNALSTVGASNVKVTGSGPFTVEFQSGLAGANLPQIESNSSGLTGSSPSVAIATTQDGANGTGTGYEICTTATTCKAGAGDGSGGTFQAVSPTSVAADSSGSIYATGEPGSSTQCSVGCRVQKFNPSATTVEEFAPSILSGSLTASKTLSSPRRVAIDPTNDRVLVARKEYKQSTFKLYEFTKAGNLIEASPPGRLSIAANTGGGNGPEGLAFGTAGRAYASPANLAALILGTAPAPKAGIEPVSAIGQTTATFYGRAEPSASGIEGGFPTVAFFEYSPDGINWSSTEPVTIGDGTGSGSPNSCPTGNPPACNVSVQALNLQPGRSYLVRMVVSNGTSATSSTESFETVAGAPGVSGMAASNPVGQTSATINGLVNPNNRSTTYHFEWGESTAYGTRIPADFDVVAGSGSQPVPASAGLTGLQPGTTYHFRIVAKSAGGTTIGPDGEFTTLNSHGLPADRGIELVSPADKRPTGGVNFILTFQLVMQASEDGESIFYSILNAIGGSTTAGQTVYQSVRSPQGWLASQVTPPTILPPPSQEKITAVTGPGQVRYGNPGTLNCAIVESHNPLSGDVPPVDLANEATNLFRRTPDGKYTLLTNKVPLEPAAEVGPGGVYFMVQGASADCSRIFFRSTTFGYLPGASGLYEWDNGVLHDAGLLPNGAVGSIVLGGATKEIPTNAVAPSGRFFFSAKSNAGLDSNKTAVFVRDTNGKVIDASQSKTAIAPTGAGYEIAAANGSSVYFLANYGLASTSSNGPTNGSCVLGVEIPTPIRACDLYRYDVDSEQLTDVSADVNPADQGQGASVAGVMAASNDGSTVYFAAFGQLIPGKGRTFEQNQSGAGFANIYRWHDGQLSFVGTIAASNLIANTSSRGGALVRNPNFWTSHTTKDGAYLLYASDEVTGVNPRGVREAYLYSAESGETTCVSCPTDGALPIESWKGPRVLQGSRSTLAGNATAGSGVATPYFPRTLTGDGRAFFTSPDKLTSDAVLGDVNIYEWHKGQLSLLATDSVGALEFVDTGGPEGEEGRDVFIRSYARLNGADFDFAPDLYDFRSGGKFTEAPQPPASCDPAADQCQGTPANPPGAPSSRTSQFSSPGNPPAPGSGSRAKCPKGKALKQGKCVKKAKKRKVKARGKKKRAAGNNHGGAK